MAGRVRVDREGALGWVVFDHRERRNAISAAMWQQIPAAARALDADPSVRVIALRGAGEEAFVSGADISEFEERRGPQTAADYEADNLRAFEALEALEKPLLALVHGPCMGGGTALLVTADLRFAADDASFGIPAARLGVAYPTPGVASLVRAVGHSAASEILLTGARFGAREALRVGLVHAVFPKAELERRVRERAEQVAAGAPLTLRAVKRALRELAGPESLRDPSARAADQRACFESEDYREGIRAFLEKRSPVFRGH